MPTKRFAIDAGAGPVDLAKLDERRRGDQYLILTSLPTGLHVSLHTSGKMHIKDHHGTYEELEPPEPPDDPLSLLEDWSYTPQHREPLLGLSNVDLDPSRYLDSGRNRDTWLLGDALKEFTVDHLWEVPADRIGAFAHAGQHRARFLVDTVTNQMVVAAPSGDETLTLGVPFEIENWMETIRTMPLLAPVLDPLFRAMEASEEVARADPDLRRRLENRARQIAGAESQELERLAEERWASARRHRFVE